MYTTTPISATPYGAYGFIQPAAGDPLNIEAPPSMGRKLTEALLYLCLINSSFISVTGLGTVRFAGGGLILIAGAVTFFVMLADRERMPISFWFAMAMNIIANLSQLSHGQTPVISEGLSHLAHWLCYLLMMCYLIHNSGSQKRVLVFFAVLLMVVIAKGGVVRRDDRLELDEIGAAFANANDLAYFCGLFAIGLLFWSLRSSKILRPLLWLAAGVLIFHLFRTVSRGAILTFACGMAVLLGAILAGRGVRLSGIILVCVSLIGASQLAYLFAGSARNLEKRAGEESVRTLVYDMQTLGDLGETVILGRGPSHAQLSSLGFAPHNSFLYTHLAYGGICAYVYIAWLAVLSIRIFRMMLANELPMDTKMLVIVMFGMGLGAQVLSNQGYVFLSTIYGIAVVEKYTFPYRRHAVRQRAARGY